MRSLVKTLAVAMAFSAMPIAAQPPVKGSVSSNSSRPLSSTNRQGAVTEEQAYERLRNAGFANISELLQDDDGTWRCRASINGDIELIGVDALLNIVGL